MNNKEMAEGSAETIRDLLEKHLPAKSKEKSDLGEVFTPPAMISNMYDHFPKEFMSRSTTFLDPASGVGNFGVVVFLRHP